VLHSPGLEIISIRPLLCNLAASLTTVEVRDLPSVSHGCFNGILDWLPNLTSLSVALDYVDIDFGHVPDDWSPSRWREAKPLQTLTLLSSGETGIDPSRSFTAVDLYALIDERFLGRLRWLDIAASAEWGREQEGAEIGALDLLLTDELDRESWEQRRWHYEGVGPTSLTYDRWIRETGIGQRMRPSLRILMNR
jgi:hypothetical protein